MPNQPRKITEADRGKATNADDAYREGYAAKYDGWTNRENPYVDEVLAEAFSEGMAEACAFA